MYRGNGRTTEAADGEAALPSGAHPGGASETQKQGGIESRTDRHSGRTSPLRLVAARQNFGMKWNKTAPWRTEPYARQRCVENIEVDADDYPCGDPQNG